jgi:hypothetical protein
MENWRYGCYDDGRNPNLWNHWYDSHPDCRGAHDATFEILEQMEIWREPNAKHLGQGLVEIKIKCERKQWRIFGTFNGKKRFIVVGVGYHKSKQYQPPNILETAAKRAQKVRKSDAYVDCKRPKAEADEAEE